MATPFVRVDVWQLRPGDPIITAYADAVEAMKKKSDLDVSDPTGWTYQAAIHGSLAQNPLPLWNECRHGGWYFVSWHRAYLYYFERIVRAQVIDNGGPSTWALPYWNYDRGGNTNQLPPAFRDPVRADGSPNPLFAPRNLTNGFSLPATATSPAAALAKMQFTGSTEFGGGVTTAAGQFHSETGALEQTPHNVVHSLIGGLMGNPDTAAQDPIFWLHHCNIDRLWWLWQKQHSDPTDAVWTGQSFDFMDTGGTQASLADADVEDTIAQLDYTYDTGIVRIPWRPIRRWWPVNWPWPWPELSRPRPPRPGPPDPGPLRRHLVGATESSIELVGDDTRVPVTIDERATEPLRAAVAADEGQHEHRAFLDIEDIEADRDPGTVYGVYVNLPDDPTEDDLDRHHVGNVSLFGVERARNPRGDEHAHGLRLTMEITDLLDRLADDGAWTEGEQLDVDFRPITLEAPADQPDAADSLRAAAAHPDLPVTIGRVSVHFS